MLLSANPLSQQTSPRFVGEIKSGVNGILVKPKDEEQLRNAMTALMRDEDLRKKLGKNLRTSFLKRTWDKIALTTLQIYGFDA